MTRPMTDSEFMDLIEALSFGIDHVEKLVESLDKRVAALEADTPQARRLQYELDATLADNAAAGYGDDGEW